MEEYIVITLHLGGKGNKIYHHGDKVTARQMNRDVEELVRKGYLAPVKPEPTAPADEDKVLTKKQIIELLEEKGVKVDKSMNKESLAELLEKTLAAETPEKPEGDNEGDGE